MRGIRNWCTAINCFLFGVSFHISGKFWLIKSKRLVISFKTLVFLTWGCCHVENGFIQVIFLTLCVFVHWDVKVIGIGIQCGLKWNLVLLIY